MPSTKADSSKNRTNRPFLSSRLGISRGVFHSRLEDATCFQGKKFFVNRSRLDFSSPPQLRPKKGFLPQALFRPRSSLPVLDGRFCHITRLPIGERAGRVFRRRVECGVEGNSENVEPLPHRLACVR